MGIHMDLRCLSRGAASTFLSSAHVPFNRLNPCHVPPSDETAAPPHPASSAPHVISVMADLSAGFTWYVNTWKQCITVPEREKFFVNYCNCNVTMTTVWNCFPLIFHQKSGTSTATTSGVLVAYRPITLWFDFWLVIVWTYVQEWWSVCVWCC